MGSTFNISATAKAIEFIFSMHLGFTKAHHKIPPRRKMGVALGWGTPYPKILNSPFIFLLQLKLATSNLARSSDLPRQIIIRHLRKKWDKGAP